jgi:hypothetical protein
LVVNQIFAGARLKIETALIRVCVPAREAAEKYFNLKPFV